MSNSSIRPINRTLPGGTTLGQSGPGSNGNEEVLHIPQSSKAEASSSDGLVLYSGHFLGLGRSLTSLQRCREIKMIN